MDRVSINSARNYSRTFLSSVRTETAHRTSPSIENRFFNFFHVSNIFRIPSLSLSLSLFELSFTNPVRDRYIPARLTFRSFGQLRRSKNILFNRERNFDTCSNSPPPIVSVLQAGGRKLRRHISTRRPSPALFDFAWLVRRSQVGRRNEETGSCVRSDRWADVDGSVRAKEGCRRINTETWSLELIPEPSKVHLETPAASPPAAPPPSSSSKSNISYMLFRASFFNRSS